MKAGSEGKRKGQKQEDKKIRRLEDKKIRRQVTEGRSQ